MSCFAVAAARRSAARSDDSHVIAVSVVPEQTCPAPRQVTDALAARLPGVVLPTGQPAKPRMLRLAVAPTPRAASAIDLADPDGAPLLHRVLALTRGPGECAALADTIALIIERYWREVGYDAPPLAPLDAAASAAATAAGPAAATAGPPPPAAAVETRRAAPPAPKGRGPDTPVALVRRGGVRRPGRRRGRTRRVRADRARRARGASASASRPASQAGRPAPLRATGQADFRRFPLRLGGYVPIPSGSASSNPAWAWILDLIRSLSAAMAASRHPSGAVVLFRRVCAGPRAPILALGWSYASAHHFYVRALARLGMAASYTSSPVQRPSDKR